MVHGAVIEYVAVERADIALANALAHAVLGRTLDELPPQTRKLLTLITDWVREQSRQHGVPAAEWRFTRKQVRDATGWGNTQLKVHLGRLEDMEYLGVHGSGWGKSIAYELRFDGASEQNGPHLMGLIDVQALPGDDHEKSAPRGEKSAVGRGKAGAVSAHGRGALVAEMPVKMAVEGEVLANAPAARMTSGASLYRHHTAPFLAAAVAAADG